MLLTAFLWRGLRFGAMALMGLLWAPAGAQAALPPEVAAALARAQVPAEAVSLWIGPVEPTGVARLAHRAQAGMNPASVMKLVTTFAALDTLGPAHAWQTPVVLDGAVSAGTLQGHLVIRGSGDPKLVVERLWLLLRRVQGLGVQRVAGDVVLDHGAFDVGPQDPAQFDGEPLRPYNAAPDALLINYKAVVMSFVPDLAARVARVQYDPPLAGVQRPDSVPLATGECGDWRAALQADLSDPAHIRLAGRYPATCGEKVWPVAYADPSSHARRAVEGLWREMGGQLGGVVRDARPGEHPGLGLTPALTLASPPLTEVVRDINKFSNNVMAQQLFLTLGLPAQGPATLLLAREAVGRWWRERLPDVAPPVLDNGSGLSRHERISAQALARLLQLAWASPVMPEYVASLPLSGVDGTLRRVRLSLGAGVPVQAHLKTGSLRDVTALAGYVDGPQGQRRVLVAMVNHPHAAAARPALEALVQWAAR